uniref:Uncharacterized protein n=1 Tax=Hyaloperonospora arabidopsidis (strain Emoy2) TaxID=559515 RepID=M4B993_HYAAE
MVVRHEGPDDVRFIGNAYEHACTLPVVKTPVFARLYDNLVARIGPYAALCQIVKRPGGPWQVTAIHNEMLEQVQFASWFKAAKDPKFLEKTAPIGKVKLAHDPIKPVEVAKFYDDFINGVLKLSSSYSGEVGSRTNSIFAEFRAGEHQIACRSIRTSRSKSERLSSLTTVPPLR